MEYGLIIVGVTVPMISLVVVFGSKFGTMFNIETWDAARVLGTPRR